MRNIKTKSCLPVLLALMSISLPGSAFSASFKLIDLNLNEYAGYRLSANGRYLIYHTGARLSRLDLYNGTLNQSIPLSGSFNITVSADGDRVAMDRGGVSRYTFSTDSVVDLVADTSVQSLTISGNGDRIAFRSSLDRGANPDGSDEWFILDTPSGTITQITDSQPAPVNLSNLPGSFNYEGTRFAFNGDFGSQVPILGLWEEGVGTLNLDQVGADYESVSLDATGDFISFISTSDITGQNPQHYGEVFGYDLKTATFTQISKATAAPFDVSETLALSGTGQIIYYVSNGNYTGQHPDTKLWSFDRQGNVCAVSDALGYQVATDQQGGRTLFWRHTDQDRLFLAIGGGPSVPTLGKTGLTLLVTLLAGAAIYLSQNKKQWRSP